MCFTVLAGGSVVYVVVSLVSCIVFGIRIDAWFISAYGTAAVCLDIVGYFVLE